MKLPIYRRYNWQLVAREYRRTIWFAVAAVIAALFVFVWLQYLGADDSRLAAELAHKSLVLDVHRLATFGAPGYTVTDWREGTTDLKVRRPQ